MQSEIPLAGNVTVINMSASGVLVKVDRRMNIGNTYLLKIGYKDNFLFVRAVVKWSFLAESTVDAYGNMVPLYLAGMHFQEVTSPKQEGIIHAIMADIEADAGQFIGNAEKSEGRVYRDDANYTGKRGAESGETIHRHAPDSIDVIIQKIENELRRYTDSNLSYYELLNVENNADAMEIKKAYYRKVKEFHPDRYSSLPAHASEKITALFSHLNETYKTLMNEEKRVHYERTVFRRQPENLSNQELSHRYFEQGKVAFWNGNFSEAEILFQHAVYLWNSSAKYFYYHAKTLLKLGKFREAEKAIRKALKIDPSNSDYLTEAGYIYHALGLSNRAEDTFEMALGKEPVHSKDRKKIREKHVRKEHGDSEEIPFNPMKAFKRIIAR
jgi:curved DNA-binding protein CbpA